MLQWLPTGGSREVVPRDLLLIGIGLFLFVSTMVVSVATAPAINQQAPEGHDQRILIGSQGGGVGWHEYGSLYLLNGTNVVWKESSANSYFDVTRTDDGTVLVGFMDGGYSSCGPYEAPCTKTGFRVIDPGPQPEVRSEYSFPVRTKKNSEVHDVERLDSGEYLLTDMEYERIFTVRNGSVTWQWNASSFYDAPPDVTRTDWLHINDVDVIDEGRYLVSVRNANQILVVQRGEGVVDVINEDTDDSNDGNCKQSGQLADYDGDGEVRCGDPDVLNHQHNPQWLGEDAVLVADSENDRVVELHRNENSQWTPVWSRSKVGGVAFDWPRDADRLPNGNTLITDTLNRRIVEINESGAIVRSVETDRIPYEADHLPAGEPVGAPRYTNTEDVGSASERDIPVLSLGLVGLKAVYPATPYWFNEPQLGVTIVSVLLVLSGVVYRGYRSLRS
jgi:hypothetical protein